MKIAVWGSYNHGNFGDYIMGLLMACHLKKQGAEVWLYRLQPHLAEQYGLRTTDSLEELFDHAAFGIWGGGTLLLEPLFGPAASAWNDDIRRLWEILQSTQCPFYCINGGGDGSSPTNRLLTSSQWHILREGFQGGTVRLESDRQLFSDAGKVVECLPDIALGVSHLWPSTTPSRPTGQPLQIGVCISNTRESRRLGKMLRAVVSLRRHAVFHFFHPHLHGIGNSNKTLLPPESRWIRHHRLEEPGQTVSFIASLDLLVCRYMHPLIVALAHGVPVLSLDPRAKSITVLEELDLGFASHLSARLHPLRLLPFLSSPRSIAAYKSRFDFARLRSLSEQSRGHFRFLSGLMEKHADA